VHDWEHLPALHETSFSACRLLGLGASGWRVALTAQPGCLNSEQVLQLETDKSVGRYRVITEAGPGQGSEIRVQLSFVTEHVTDVDVRYFAPERDPVRLERIAGGFVAAYARLWDEDELMMRHRESACRIAAVPKTQDQQPLELGKLDDVVSRSPFEVQFGGRPWRVIALNGKPVVHAALCPHWLGPLENAPESDGSLRCPWHFYRFDAQTGVCLSGQPYRLPDPPLLLVDERENVALISREIG
jgi:nitrite reductase/ring-hydroxylating ferredoxin subunit